MLWGAMEELRRCDVFSKDNSLFCTPSTNFSTKFARFVELLTLSVRLPSLWMSMGKKTDDLDIAIESDSWNEWRGRWPAAPGRFSGTS